MPTDIYGNTLDPTQDPLYKFMNTVVPAMRLRRIQEIQDAGINPAMHGAGGPPPIVHAPPINVQQQNSPMNNIADQMLQAPGTPGLPTGEQTAQLGLKQAQLGEKTATDQAKLGLEGQKVGISGQRAAVYQFKAQNPGVKIIAPKGGNLQAINTATGQIVKDFGSAGTLTEEERMELDESNKEQLAGVKGDQTRQTNDAKAKEPKWSAPVQTYDSTGKPGKVIQVDATSGQTRDYVNTPVGMNKGVAPTDARVGMQSPALAERQAPSVFSGAIKPDTTQPTTTQETLTDASGKVTGGKTTVKMRGKNGQTYHVPTDKLGQAEKDGFTHFDDPITGAAPISGQ